MVKTFTWRVCTAHLVTYTIAGAFAYQLLNYKALFSSPPFSFFMRPTDSAWVAAGPALQIIRGVILSFVLWPFREAFLHHKLGWLRLWFLIIGLTILSTAAAAPGSVEGFIYTTIPIKKQLTGYFELMPQTLAFSLIIFYWHKHPGKVWNIVMGTLFILFIAMSVTGLIFRQPA